MQVDFLIAVIRIPKSASVSLSMFVDQAFKGARFFHLPNTLNPELSLSPVQRLRHARHVARHSLRNYGVVSSAAAYRAVNREAKPGDVLTGGHLDFATLSKNVAMPVKMIFLVRDPAERALSEYNYARAGFQKKNWLARFDAAMLAQAAGRYDFDGFLDFQLDHAPAYADIACKCLGLPSADEAVIESHLARHALHYGYVERAQGFVDSIGRATGRAIELPRKNVTGKKTTLEVTPAQRKKLDRLYANDFRLYGWIRRRADEASTPAAAYA